MLDPVHPFRRHRRCWVNLRCTQAGFLYPASKPIQGLRRRRVVYVFSKVTPVARINLTFRTANPDGVEPALTLEY